MGSEVKSEKDVLDLLTEHWIRTFNPRVEISMRQHFEEKAELDALVTKRGQEIIDAIAALQQENERLRAGVKKALTIHAEDTYFGDNVCFVCIDDQYLEGYPCETAKVLLAVLEGGSDGE